MKYKLEELLPVVIKLSEKYTGKESTSVTYEAAEQLMTAIIYCIEEKEIVEGKANDSVEIIKQARPETAEAAYQRGYELVLKKAFQAKELFETIIIDFKSYRNRAYYETIVKGMPAFFQYYNARFEPQNHLLTLDYPTIIQINDLCGVDAIYQYLSYIQLEQTFLSAFSDDYVIDVLTCFHNEYEELFINVCAIMMRNVLGHMIVGKKIEDKKMIAMKLSLIREHVKGNTREEIENELLDSLRTLVNEGYQQNEKLFEYLKEDIPDFAFDLMMETQV